MTVKIPYQMTGPTGCLYLIHIGPRVYVGQSIDVERRFLDHLRALENNIHHSTKCQRAYNKYGNPKFEVWGTGFDKRFMNGLEMLFIRLLGKKNVLNETKGGEGSLGRVVSKKTRAKLSQSMRGERNGMYGRKMTDEAKRRISEYRKNAPEEVRKKQSQAQTGKVLSAETRAKISVALRGRSNTMAGRKHSEETRKKLSENKRGYWERKRSPSLC